jgi:hypothetical protein
MSTFADFQKTEYEHVAEAHFKASEAISLFLRHYFLVMSLPLPVLGVLFGLIGPNDNFEKVAMASPREIGGLLIGQINFKRKIVYVTRFLFACFG